LRPFIGFGNFRPATAAQLAARAKTRLPVGSPGWVQADDIVNLKATAAKKPFTP